jgi:hypothetical protein
MKKNTCFLIIFFITCVSVFAQEASLRIGFYRVRGKADEILILPGTAFDKKADGFRQRYGYYGMSVWSGPVKNNQLKFIATGKVTGKNIIFTVDDVNANNISIGSSIKYTILKHRQFQDNTGQKWEWQRDCPGY